MYIAPSRPPVAKTAGSVLRNAAVLTERLCPLKTRDSTKFESRTSHNLAVWSPAVERNQFLFLVSSALVNVSVIASCAVKFR